MDFGVFHSHSATASPLDRLENGSGQGFQKNGDRQMKLSTKGRYAVMAMADLAMRQIDQPVALADIASRQQISLSYLEQLFSKMRKAGLVTANRGPGGGYMLAFASDQIRISDVIMAVDEPISATRCGNTANKGCLARDGSRCITHDLWEELSRQIYLYLSSVTLEDVTEKRILGTAQLYPITKTQNEFADVLEVSTSASAD
jgi:Rrf2 family transcriptional regulator, iron-sulfur cluster assembly transcription factor